MKLEVKTEESEERGGGLGDVRLSELSDVWCHLVQLWCPPARWQATTPRPQCTPALSTGTRVTPGQGAGGQSSTLHTTNNNCPARALPQTDTTTTITGEHTAHLKTQSDYKFFLIRGPKVQTKLPSFNSSREELGLIESFDTNGALITTAGVTPVTILDIEDVEIVSL